MLDGEVVGITPTEVELSRKLSHRIILKKEGYKTIDASVVPMKNAAGDDLVKFGLLDAAGYYYDLDPNPVAIQMTPDVIPPTRGPDAYAEMTEVIAMVDEKRQNGEIGPVEHKYIVDRVITFYTQ